MPNIDLFHSMKPSELLLVNNFSSNDWKGYTVQHTGGSGIAIDTTNKWVISSGSRWNGQAYKPCWLSQFSQRVKFSFTNTSIAGNRWWSVACWVSRWIAPIPNTQAVWVAVTAQQWSIAISIAYNWMEYSKKTIAMTLWSDYYIDFIFSNGLVIWKYYDNNLNLIETVQYNTSLSVLPYKWFNGWEHNATGHFYKILWYWNSDWT